MGNRWRESYKSLFHERGIQDGETLSFKHGNLPTSMETNYLPSDYLPILIQLAAALGFVVVTMVTTNYLLPALKLGPRRRSKIKDDSWECGIEAKGDARTPISVKYFLTAILFVLFDVEIIFLYPWAVNFKELGWVGFWEMLLFMGLLLVGFLYIFKKGVLKWEQ